MSKIIYYTSQAGDNPVKDFLDRLLPAPKAKIFRIFQYIEQYGLSAVLPHVKKLSGTKVWEIRILGRDNVRVLYVILSRDSILVLHGFIKKSQKTPNKDINIALFRLADYHKRQK